MRFLEQLLLLIVCAEWHNEKVAKNNIMFSEEILNFDIYSTSSEILKTKILPKKISG